MNLSAWLASLRAAETPADGFTTRDICKALSIGERSARERLRSAFDSGNIVHVGFRTEHTTNGRPYRAPVYQYNVGGTNGSTSSAGAPKARRKARRR